METWLGLARSALLRLAPAILGSLEAGAKAETVAGHLLLAVAPQLQRGSRRRGELDSRKPLS